MKKLLTVLILVILLAFLGITAFRYLVTDRVADRGGMENPDYTQTDECAGS